MAISIIERDIEFYRGVVEEYQRQLRRCLPSEESAIKHRITTCVAVVDALVAHGVAIGCIKT